MKDGGRETKLLTEIVENYESYSTGVLTFDEFMGSVLEATRDLEDYLMFEERRLSGKWDAFAHVVEEVIESVNDLYSINLSRKSSIVIAREVGSQLSPMARLSRWKSVHIQSVDALAALIRSHNRFAASVSDRITSEIYSILGIEVDALTWTLVALHAWGFETKDRRKNFGIILAHGYSTATSIADAANRLLGARLFEAIDMPYELQVRDIVRPLRSLIDRFSYCDEVVILVDTGSLKTIHEDLGQLSDKTIGVINNVSTGLALEVGAGMLAGLSMDEMLSEAVHSCTSSYRIVERSSRPDAIIFCEEGGIEAAEKIKTLVAQSLGQESSIRLIACNYFQLMDNGKEDAVFSRYTVRAAIGTSDLHLSGVPFIALEDLIAGVDNAQVNRTFSRFLDDASLQLFHRNLIKNMTLRNVVESITILNPSKLFAEIERAVSMLQTFTDTSIEGRMIGLYVHLCCLVERLVTRTPIENYEDKDNFTEEHSDFIDAFRESFSDIASHYHVEVPIAEIAYAYDYIFPAHALRKRVPSQDGSVVQEDE